MPTFKDKNRWIVIRWLMWLLTFECVSAFGLILLDKDVTAVLAFTGTFTAGIFGILTAIYATKPSKGNEDGSQ